MPFVIPTGLPIVVSTHQPTVTAGTGTNVTSFTLAATSVALIAGDFFCVDGTGTGQVTKAVAAALTNAFGVAGMALEAVAPGYPFSGQVSGVTTGTGLGAVGVGYVTLNTTTARAQRVTTISSGDYLLGITDPTGAVTFTLQPKAIVASGGAVTLAGDVSGASGSNTVDKIKATTITTAGGSLAVGAALRTTAGGTADWGTLDLANAAARTGILPTANQAAQAMGGNVTGTTAASIITLSTLILTTTTGGFTMPAIGSTVSVGVGTTAFMYQGLIISCIIAGYFAVSSITNGTTVVLQNIGGVANADAGAAIPTAQAVGLAAGRPLVGHAQVDADEAIGTFTSTMVDLGTAGPSVTLVTYGVVLVTMSARLFSTSAVGGSGWLGVNVSGATTTAATTASAGGILSGTMPAASKWVAMSRTIRLAVTAGTNTFKLQYASDSATGSPQFGARSLTVQAF